MYHHILCGKRHRAYFTLQGVLLPRAHAQGIKCLNVCTRTITDGLRAISRSRLRNHGVSQDVCTYAILAARYGPR